MVSVAVLKKARTLHESGSDLLRRGKSSEAQRDFMEVLVLLSEKITLTGEDATRRKEMLVLTAHLNLAVCALRHGNNAGVIDHCNKALAMDSNNVNAHYWKARAFENMSEFSKALEGYRHVLTLEPDNETVQRHVSECEEKLDNQRVDEDIEVGYENSESDSLKRYKNCTKHPGHHKFIDINHFRSLPPMSRDLELLSDHVKNQIEITVLLMMRGPSEHRPKDNSRTGLRYPLSDETDRNKTITGSGWLDGVSDYERKQPCPCSECQKSGPPRKGWAEIYIETAAHLVFDEIEGGRTECYFFYDTEEVDLQSCPKLISAVEVVSSVVADKTQLTFISHDEQFTDRLRNIHQTYCSGVLVLKRKYNDPPSSDPELNPRDKLAQLRRRFHKLMTEQSFQLAKLKDKLNNNEYALNDNEYALLAESISENHKTAFDICRAMTSWENAEMKNPAVVQAYQAQYNLYQSFAKRLENEVNRLRLMLSEDDTPPRDAETNNSDHRLTIIVSHPHGRSKKITIGWATGKSNQDHDQFSQYRYNTPTCKGSSGALVYILGQGLGPSNHPHSASRSYSHLGQSNE